MLVEAMTPKEIFNEVSTDYPNVRNSLDRLGANYERERRKKGIDKGSVHSKVYPIKTKKKNTWILVFSKAPTADFFKGLNDVNVLFAVYYYTNVGLRVFKIPLRPNNLHVYNAHFFTRYKERLFLDISDPIEIVKHFFINNGYSSSKIIPHQDKQLAITTFKEGLGLGELQEKGTWVVNKTFISRDLIRPDQDDIEKELITSLQTQIEKSFRITYIDDYDYRLKVDIMKGITGNGL